MNQDPFFKRRGVRKGLALAGGVLALSAIAGCSTTRPAKVVTVATCSPAKAGANVIGPDARRYLDQPDTDYRIAIANANGKVLRSYDIGTSNSLGSPTRNFDANHNFVPEVTLDRSNTPDYPFAGTHDLGGVGDDGTDDVAWDGNVEYISARSITGTTIEPSSWRRDYISRVRCPAAHSILYLPDGSVQTMPAN